MRQLILYLRGYIVSDQGYLRICDGILEGWHFAKAIGNGFDDLCGRFGQPPEIPGGQPSGSRATGTGDQVAAGTVIYK